MNRTENIDKQIETLKNLDNKAYLTNILDNNIDEITIAYFAYDDLSANPYRQWISKGFLLNRQLKNQINQTKCALGAIIISLIATIISFIALFVE